jgi:hypothetical protein
MGLALFYSWSISGLCHWYFYLVCVAWGCIQNQRVLYSAVPAQQPYKNTNDKGQEYFKGIWVTDDGNEMEGKQHRASEWMKEKQSGSREWDRYATN